MKQSSLLLLTVILGGATIAQPTITGTTLNPNPGEKFYIVDCDVAGISKGASGPGVSWNFAALATLSTDSLEYSGCPGTPYCDTFPGTNIVFPDGGTDYECLIGDANALVINGVGLSIGSVYFSNPQSLICYPMTMNTVKVDTYAYAQPAFQTYSYGIDSFVADGYGTLTLPSGVFSNVLRVHMIMYSTDSMTFNSPPLVDKRRSEMYFWYTPGFHNPLLVMYYDTIASPLPTLTDVAYYKHKSTAANPLIAEATQNLEVYPNPVNDAIHLKFHAATPGNLTICLTDPAGREMAAPVKSVAVQGDNDIEYSMLSLPAGIYVVKIQTGDQVMYKKICKTR